MLFGFSSKIKIHPEFNDFPLLNTVSECFQCLQFVSFFFFFLVSHWRLPAHLVRLVIAQVVLESFS